MYDKVGVCLICMPYMHALYVCLICKHNGNNLLQVGVCLICMPCMYALDTCGRVSGSSLGRVLPYMYALYVCLICMPYMYALYVCLICMPYIQVGVCREGVLAACWLAMSLGVFLRDTLGYLDAHAASRASDSPQRELYLAAKKADVEEVRHVY
jgi:hypothetical protein